MYTEQDYRNEINRLQLLFQEALSTGRECAINYKKDVEAIGEMCKNKIDKMAAHYEKIIAEKDAEILL
jgi:hypothetical protein